MPSTWRVRWRAIATLKILMCAVGMLDQQNFHAAHLIWRQPG